MELFRILSRLLCYEGTIFQNLHDHEAKNMNAPGSIKKVVATLLIFALSSCGGSSSPPPNPNLPPVTTTPPGRTGAVITVGTVTGFGSVIQNGIEYDTDTATFTVDGESASQSDLAVGDVVIIKGTIEDDNTGAVAQTVEFDDNVEGPIETGSIDTDAGTFRVLGTLVHSDDGTSFDDGISPASIFGLSDGDVVEVSGLVRPDGSVQATRIEPKTLLPGDLFEVTGTVAAPITSTSFMINSLVVDFATRSAVFDNFPNGRNVAEGDPVEVKGEQTLGPSGELIATRVEFKGARLDGAEGDHVEIEGFISRFGSSQDFDVSFNGIDITVSTDPATTIFEGGVASDLGLNIKVEVEGEYDAMNVLIATKVEIKAAKAVRIIALVDSVDPAPAGGGLPFLVMLDVTVEVDPTITRFDDKTDAEPSFNITHVNAGDYLEVRGQEMPAGSDILFAAILERDDDPQPGNTVTVLRGFLENKTPLTILGVTIDTSGGPVFRDASGAVIPTEADFLNMVDVGTLIKAKGAESGGNSIIATEIEIKNP
jgi:hypothetical protein